jgi:hypothetical protein
MGWDSSAYYNGLRRWRGRESRIEAMVLQLDGCNCESEKNMAHLNVCLHSMKTLRKILENDYVTTRTLCPKEETSTETTDTNDVKKACIK